MTKREAMRVAMSRAVESEKLVRELSEFQMTTNAAKSHFAMFDFVARAKKIINSKNLIRDET